jgi:dTDP-4-dehydrorhamnose reductase
MDRAQLRSAVMSDTILIFGANGQIGWELQRALAPLANVIALTRRDVDIADVDRIAATIASARPDVVVNAAAYTAVDKAESDVDSARAANAVAPGVMAEAAKRCGALLVHYSTDYVFDGSKAAPYVEEDAPHPLSVYGRTKLEGEMNVAASEAQFLTFRTTWVFAARGSNFMRTVLRLARERDTLAVVDDQVGAPTSAELIADVTAHAIRLHRREALTSGLYHLSSTGGTTWWGYARWLVEEAAREGVDMKLKSEGIRAIGSAEYGAAAPRPRNSRLDCSRVTRLLDLRLPDWQTTAARTLREILRS